MGVVRDQALHRKENKMRRTTLIVVLFLSLASCQEEAAEDAGSAEGEGGEEEECEEAWSYVEFLKEEVTTKLEVILQETLYEAKEKRGETVLADTVSKTLDGVIEIREAIIMRIKAIRKGDESITICEGQSIDQEEKLSQFRMDIMNILLQLVNSGDASVAQLQAVSEGLLSFRMSVSQEIMRMLMLPQGTRKAKPTPGTCDCEFLENLSKNMENTVQCAEKASGSDEDKDAEDGAESGDAAEGAEGAEGEAGGECMPPAMYNMDLIAANELIDAEVQQLYRSIITTTEEELRNKLLTKLTDYKEIRNENEENIAKLMKADQEDEYYIKIVTRSVKKTQKKVTQLKRDCLAECNPEEGCPEPGKCAVEVIEDTKEKMEEYMLKFDNEEDPADAVQFVRNGLMKFITEINEKATDIITRKAMMAIDEEQDNCDKVKGEVYDKIKGPLWMLVNTTIFGQPDGVQAMITAMQTQLDELHAMYCTTDIVTEAPQTDDPQCEWKELEKTKDYLEEVDSIIQDSLFKGNDEDARKKAMLGFVDLRKMFDERITELFKKGVVCPDELMKIKTEYMPDLNKCMAEFMNPKLDFAKMNRVDRISCTKGIRNNMETQMIKLLQFEVKNSLDKIQVDGGSGDQAA